MHPFLRRSADLLDRAGLGEPAFRIFQRLQALTAQAPSNTDPLLPPAYLRVLTAGVPDADNFLRQGRAAAAEFLQLARRHGLSLTADQRVLEFGCGSGRVGRWFIAGCEARFSGCDVNDRLVRWCRQNLNGDFTRTKLAPPLPYADATFDLVYALSVFTHMHETNARAWFAELARVVRPGGLALLTYQDDRLVTAAALQPRLGLDGFAIRREGAEGGNLLSSYFTPTGLADRAGADWQVLDHVPTDASAHGQAVAILRKVSPGTARPG
jgi:SAM-dependent methyltransferase